MTIRHTLLHQTDSQTSQHYVGID